MHIWALEWFWRIPWILNFAKRESSWSANHTFLLGFLQCCAVCLLGLLHCFTLSFCVCWTVVLLYAFPFGFAALLSSCKLFFLFTALVCAFLLGLLQWCPVVCFPFGLLHCYTLSFWVCCTGALLYPFLLGLLQCCAVCLLGLRHCFTLSFCVCCSAVLL